MKKKGYPGCLGYIGDEILPSWDYFMNRYLEFVFKVMFYGFDPMGLITMSRQPPLKRDFFPFASSNF